MYRGWFAEHIEWVTGVVISLRSAEMPAGPRGSATPSVKSTKKSIMQSCVYEPIYTCHVAVFGDGDFVGSSSGRYASAIGLNTWAPIALTPTSQSAVSESSF